MLNLNLKLARSSVLGGGREVIREPEMYNKNAVPRGEKRERGSEEKKTVSRIQQINNELFVLLCGFGN